MKYIPLIIVFAIVFTACKKDTEVVGTYLGTRHEISSWANGAPTGVGDGRRDTTSEVSIVVTRRNDSIVIFVANYVENVVPYPQTNKKYYYGDPTRNGGTYQFKRGRIEYTYRSYGGGGSSYSSMDVTYAGKKQ